MIRLHSAYGFNPTLVVCLFCGKDKGDIALLGAAYKEQAPMRMVIDNVPCENCQKKMALGTAIIVVDPRDTSSTPRVGYLQAETGEYVKFMREWHVVKTEAMKERFGITSPWVLTSVQDARKLGLDPSIPFTPPDA